MKVYHIVCHSLESIYPGFVPDEESFASLNHTVNKFVSKLMKYGKTGGYEHVLVNLSTRLEKDRAEFVHKDGYNVIALRATSIFGPIEFSLPLIHFIRSAKDGAIFHVHGTSSYIYDSIAPFLSGKKFIAHYRGGHLTLRAFPILFPKYCILAPLTFRMPKRIFVQNQERMRKLSGSYFVPKEKLVFLPNGISPEDFAQKNSAFAESIARKFKIRKGAVRIFFAGRLVAGKGIPLLLEAFSRIRRKSPDAVLIVAGEGPLEESVKSKAGQGVLYVGHVDRKGMVSLYHYCDIFAFPSEYDSFANVIAEAMACGKPVVATRTEGANQLVADNSSGFLVRIGDLEGFSEKLAALVSDKKLCEEFGTRGKAIITKSFLWKDILPTVFRTYSGI